MDHIQRLIGMPAKKKIDMLFLCHSGFAAVCGLFAFILPHVWEYFFIPHGEKLRFRDNAVGAEQKITHLTIRLYGALIIAQVRASVQAAAVGAT